MIHKYGGSEFWHLLLLDLFSSGSLTCQNYNIFILLKIGICLSDGLAIRFRIPQCMQTVLRSVPFHSWGLSDATLATTVGLRS